MFCTDSGLYVPFGEKGPSLQGQILKTSGTNKPACAINEKSNSQMIHADPSVPLRFEHIFAPQLPTAAMLSLFKKLFSALTGGGSRPEANDPNEDMKRP